MTWLGKLLGVTDIGTVNRSPKPNFAAWDCSALAPSCMPSQPKALLQETSSAWVSEVLLLGPQGWWSSVGSVAVVCGSVRDAGPGSWLCSVNLPEPRAAAAVTSLNVDPGG